MESRKLSISSLAAFLYLRELFYLTSCSRVLIRILAILDIHSARKVVALSICKNGRGVTSLSFSFPLHAGDIRHLQWKYKEETSIEQFGLGIVSYRLSVL
jgi:hypothetical protein